MRQKIATIRQCGHCGSPAIDFRGDYPACRMCGWEDYAHPMVSVFRANLTRSVKMLVPGNIKGWRFCEDCGADISDRYKTTRFCLPCRAAHYKVGA